MFDWFWEFLYGLSKALMWLCDKLMECANILMGITPINVGGGETDLLTYLISHHNVQIAFAACAIISIILLTMFTLFQIIKTMTKMGEGVPPGQLAVKSFKTFLIFLFVPFIMMTLITFMSIFMTAVYKATSAGTNSIGQFLFVAFSEDAWHSGVNADDFINSGASYYNTSQVWNYIDLSDFSFLYSWIVGAVLVYNISASMLMFVDRAISIVILFILAPFPISASVIDEGQRFKSWREQVLNKFLAAFGVLIALNIYVLVCGAISSSSVRLAENSFVNTLGKILFMIGGAVTSKKAGALVGSMISASAANEVNDPAFRGNAMLGALGAMVSAPFKAGRAAWNFGQDVAHKGLKQALGNRLGIKVDKDYQDEERRMGGGGGGGGGSEGGSGSKNEGTPKYNDKSDLKEALEGGNEKNNDNNNNNNNENNNQPNNKGNEMMNNALNGGDDKLNQGNGGAEE